MRTALLALIAAMASIAALAQGMTCSPETIRGNWGVTRDGYLTPAPNAPLAPTKILGACKSPDGVNFVCEAAASIGGTVVKQEMNGAAITASDCTGTIKYVQKINGQAAPDMNIRFFIAAGGKQIKGLPVDSGTVLSCTLDRIGM